MLAPTVATLVVVVLCVTAGEWQRGRMHAKEALRAQYDAAAAAPPLAAAALKSVAPEWSAVRYRMVDVAGRFDVRHLMLLDNKVHEGRVGYQVVVPLLVEDGPAVLVNRGWVPLGASRAELPAVRLPEGDVRLRGRINLPAAGYVELAPEQAGATVWQHLDIARMAKVSGLELLPIIVEEAPQDASPDGLVRAWPEPDFGVTTHRMYMMQWYAFAVVAVLFWAWAHRPRRHLLHAGVTQ